jgi:hypothetical protein
MAVSNHPRLLDVVRDRIRRKHYSFLADQLIGGTSMTLSEISMTGCR